MEKIMETKRSIELVTIISLCCIPFLVIYHRGNFGFWVIQKITYANLCQPIHNIIVTPISSDSLDLETVESKGK